MLENGFVKLHRSLLKWEWYDDLNTFKLFMHLLLTVSIEDSTWHGVEVKRGERVTSYATLSKETKLSVRSIRTSLNHLISTGEVTKRIYSKFTIIKVNNFDKFQKATNRSTSNRQSSDKVATSNRQQYKKIKEDNKKIKEGPSAPAGAPGVPAMTEEERLEKIKRLRR